MNKTLGINTLADYIIIIILRIKIYRPSEWHKFFVSRNNERRLVKITTIYRYKIGKYT
jgi:hypothetical protein